jgi:hypothetical protein
VGNSMIEVPPAGLLWATGMKRYWPRIFRYLERSTVAYRFGSLAAADESFGRTTRTTSNVVQIQFHPLLADKGPSSSLLLGNLAHEGIHAILYAATSGQSMHLPVAQVRRLVETHRISQNPPGYGERLLEIRGSTDETGIELLTNKLLVDRGLPPLVRGRNAQYDATAH